MTDSDNTVRDSQHESVEEAAQEGPLPGVGNIDRAEEEGREDSAVPGNDDASTNGPGTDDDAEDIAAGGVILGAIHGR
ncbi:hypothetical protein [Jatrophihabitans lederbergiae]|uniref:Uncharacterized protein n=1 Tax=Jatrophihabitans lederbergiae TaxID=3075547 RepID=A0ABU2J8V9_9ACTN|nr:hypothetical protein [Jatrophihabitans sp. DSM 44399]MDT0261186.1 hypothetical protein [Jatrophihabitans sp. DSM 44399]